MLPFSVIPSFRIQFPLIFSFKHGDFLIQFGTQLFHENTRNSGRIFFGIVIPLWLRKMHFIFSFRSLSPLQIDILNWNSLYICVCHNNTKIEFECGSGQIIFGIVMPLRLGKIPLIFSFRSTSPLQIDTLDWNLVYRCVTRIHRSISNLGPVE